MDDKQLENILRLLSIVILADKKVYPEEVDVMSSMIKELCSEIDQNLFITKKMAGDWFRMNRASLESVLQGPYRNDFIHESLLSLKDSPHTQNLHKLILKVSNSDGEFHEKERSLAILAERLWSLD